MDIQSFMRTAEAFRESSVILTAVELNLFDHIRETGSTAAEISREVQMTERAATILLNALVALGLLSKQENRYLLSEFSKKHLVRESPEYLGFMNHLVRLWHNWNELPVIARNPDHVEELKKERNVEEFIIAMHHRGIPESVQAIQKLDIHHVTHFVDVGCGSGIFGITAKKLNPTVKVTFIDQPEVIRLTKQFCKEEGIQDEVEFLEGDFFHVPFPDGCDMIFLSSIIHIYDPETNTGLLKKAEKSLRKGGKVVIRDFFLNPDRTSPSHAALFAVNMLIHTKGGNAYTEEDIQQWMKKAGFTFEKRILTGGKADLIIGFKS
jgi:precorrin-6B methylase 2